MVPQVIVDATQLEWAMRMAREAVRPPAVLNELSSMTSLCAEPCDHAGTRVPLHALPRLAAAEKAVARRDGCRSALLVAIRCHIGATLQHVL